MGSENDQWVWRIKGLGGVLNSLEALADLNCPPNRHRIADIKAAEKRLAALHGKLIVGVEAGGDHLESSIIGDDSDDRRNDATEDSPRDE